MHSRRDNSRNISAPTGTNLSCLSWTTEAAMRMLMNNLDSNVAEAPEELVVYGGIGRAARDWESYDTIVATLKRLKEDETLLVQSGKPVGVFRTHEDAPRVLIANSNLVPKWADWDHFNELDKKGLMMYGQMTAGSWIYIGTQGIVQGTYETFAEMGRQHYDGDLRGRWILTAGLGGMGGAQPLAAVMAGAHCIAIECQESRIEKRLETRYLDKRATSIDEALDMLREAPVPISVGLLGNAAEILPEMVKRGIKPDAVTDQTSAHDPVNGYLPIGWTVEQWIERRERDPKAVEHAARASMAVHVEAMLDYQRMGVPAFDYGNNIRQVAKDEGVANAFDFPGFVPAYVRPLFCRGVGPFRWAALSGDPEDIYRTDAKVKELIPDDPHLHRWLDMARERIAFQGLPARICWVGLGQRHRLGLAFNEMVASGELKAPVVIGRDHLDSGSVASPNRETEAMADGSDAVSDWPLLNALLNTASGATWVSLHHGGGVGMGYSQHAGMVIVADGTPEAARRLERVLWNDPGTGVMRHADAGYEIAIDCAREQGLDLPMVGEMIVLNPGHATLAELRAVWDGAAVSLHDDAWVAIDASAASISRILASGRTVYGVNTGFGLLANTRIPDDRLAELQRNLILSHACGLGDPLDARIVRLAMILKAIGLGRGHSGVRRNVVERILQLVDADALPVIPSQGSVGASGDLAPLAHMSAALLGEGDIILGGECLHASEALKYLGLEPLALGPKEGLALINGTQISTAIALDVLFTAERVFASALVAGALSTDALKASTAPFDPRLSAARGQKGQIAVAEALRGLLEGSAIGASHEDCGKVQDPYSFRCQPQVMGAALDLIRGASAVLEIEANAVSDNPLIFADSDEAISGGNFHAQPVAFAADQLAIALCEIGSLSERRTAVLVDPKLSGLPPFLIADSGLNSGFMILQVSAAALVSENKSYAFPASVDTIPTSAGQEDHVSMATHGALKARRIARNAAGVIGIELLAAAQGVDFHAPLESSAPLAAAHAAIRAEVPHHDKDRYLAPDVAWAQAAVLDGAVSGAVQASLF